MPEVRYQTINTYKDGVLIDTQSLPYVVSDEQLEREASEKILNDVLNLADGDIKVPQIGKILKALVRLRR